MNVFKTSLVAAAPVMVIADERVGESTRSICDPNRLDEYWLDFNTTGSTHYYQNRLMYSTEDIRVVFGFPWFDREKGCVVQPRGSLRIEIPGQTPHYMALSEQNTEIHDSATGMIDIKGIKSYFGGHVPDVDFKITFLEDTLLPSFREPLELVISSTTVIVSPGLDSRTSLESSDQNIDITLNHYPRINSSFGNNRVEYVADSGDVIEFSVSSFELNGDILSIPPPDGHWPAGYGTLNIKAVVFNPNMESDVSLQFDVPVPEA